MPIMNMDDKDGKLEYPFIVLDNLIIAKIQFICSRKNLSMFFNSVRE